MSHKMTSPGKLDPKIPPREVMVTRHKSAQMKRQLRTKDRSMKHLTDLLKSPTKETQTSSKNVKKKQPSPKARQSLLKSVEKIQNLPQKTFKLSKVLRKEIRLVADEEYHPNKRKRKITVKKVVLKPKTTMKVVGEITGSVKRKYAVPLKASDNPTPAQVQQPGPESCRMTMAEAIRIMDERLTDEDMMEILTCPSPVWWEDPPDERYDEDALFTRTVAKKKVATAESAPIVVDCDIEHDTSRMILIPNLSTKSDKFLKKRSKLEDLLGNIKNKSNTKQNNETKGSNKVAIGSKDCKPNEIKDDVAKSDKVEAKMSESDDEIVFHNSSMNEDELLQDLENMDIPIANQSQSNEVIVIDDDDDDDFLDKATSKKAVTEENKIPDDHETVICDTNKGDDEITVNNKADDEITVNNNTSIESVKEFNKNNGSNDDGVPKNLPALQKCNLSKEVSSPKSFDSLSSKSSTSLSSKDVDTISDTNVRFLLDDEIDDQKTNKMDSKNDESVKGSSESKDLNKGDDNITVYKIIEEINDSTENVKEPNEMEKPKSKLHEAYKNCIKVYQKRMKMAKRDTDMNKNELSDEENYTTKFCDQCKPHFKRVSDDENVKYCLSCSSIFDSNDCTYCIKNSNRTYSCAHCKIKFCCAVFYITHEKNCLKDREGLKISDKLDIDPNVGVVSYAVYPDAMDSGLRATVHWSEARQRSGERGKNPPIDSVH